MKPFQIHVPDSVLADLQQRLALPWRGTHLAGQGWRYGADIEWLQSTCAYWRDQFDWRAQEAWLNRYPQFIASAGGTDLHFVHVRSERSAGLPLLLLHGWPGSFLELLGLIEPLTAAGHDVVIPSLPGFAFSRAPREPGWGMARMAASMNALMTEVLGYARYGVQGGDWGTMLGARIARSHAPQVAALHINMAYAPPPPGVIPPAGFGERMNDLTGYLHVQNTRPDTLTVGLSQSPMALAAWLLEKFHSWSDCGGLPERAIPRDVLLTNLMLYWVTDSIASATRIYFESANEGLPVFGPPRVEVPTGVAAFPAEPYLVPRAWLEPLYNIERWTDMPRGGHFAALEQPQLLADDVLAFFAGRR